MSRKKQKKPCPTPLHQFSVPHIFADHFLHLVCHSKRNLARQAHSDSAVSHDAAADPDIMLGSDDEPTARQT